MRGLPFLLAHIEVVVARRAPPVDARCGLAGDEAAVLPEILARAGATASVHAMDDGRGDAARFQDQPRHGGGERTPVTDGAPDRLGLMGTGRAVIRHPLSDHGPLARTLNRAWP